MTASAHLAMRTDSRLWSGDLTHWETDVVAWQRELADATAELDRLAETAGGRRNALESDFRLSGEALIGHHRTALEQHWAALACHRDRLRGEQGFLTEYAVATGRNGTSEPPAEPLIGRMTRHPRLWEAHDRMGRHHQTMMASTARLIRALRSGGEAAHWLPNANTDSRSQPQAPFSGAVPC